MRSEKREARSETFLSLLKNKDVDSLKDWSLFLDRDGVINKREIGKYTTKWEDFIFLDGVLEAMPIFNELFQHIFIVTNQQGIGKGIMSAQSLEDIHEEMAKEMVKKGGRIDQAYYSPYLAKDDPPCRKPNTGMGLQAKVDFPEVDFHRSIMIGDSISDIEFGKRLSMITVLIEGKTEEDSNQLKVDYRFDSLYDFAQYINS